MPKIFFLVAKSTFFLDVPSQKSIHPGSLQKFAVVLLPVVLIAALTAGTATDTTKKINNKIPNVLFILSNVCSPFVSLPVFILLLVFQFTPFLHIN
jgi:hypothetical protein